MKLSIVATLYYSAPHLAEFCSRIISTAGKLTQDFELILVNDGSPDNALAVALSERARDSRIKIIDLSRNFGHHQAMMTGLRAASGERVYLTDCDLEVAPETLENFDTEWQRLSKDAGPEGIDVVCGIQEQRQDPWPRRVPGSVYYSLYNWLSDTRISRNFLTERLMSRRYVLALGSHQEREITISGLMSITGFRQESFVVKKSFKGSSTYTTLRRFRMLVNSITNFSAKPLWGVFWMGVISFSVSLGYAFWLVIQRLLLNGVGVSGWTSVMVSMWVIGGLVLMSIGVVGVYLAKVFSEVKQRPVAVIRARYGWGDAE